ncbi:MAG: hypothetical protein ACXABY_23105 [Candidatus Thorarchaeota archaeon]|jgi:hypothetical protein
MKARDQFDIGRFMLHMHDKLEEFMNDPNVSIEARDWVANKVLEAAPYLEAAKREVTGDLVH